MVNFLDDRLPGRFWNRCVPDPMGGCWLWIGGSTQAGYGVFTVDGRRSSTKCTTAHRHAYVTLVAPVADHLDIDHRCKVRCCVNPTHLRAVTRRVNLQNSNSISTVNAAKTVCPQGHPYLGENIYTAPNGNRQCRACRRERDLKRRRAA